MSKQTYFYSFLEPISKELAYVARELENSVFTGPRTMLTHARTFIENILKHVMKIENVEELPMMNLIDRIQLLHQEGIIDVDVLDALHFVRLRGNEASHDSRMFRYSEALLSWEKVYIIVKWFAEVYGPVNEVVPNYQDPAPNLKFDNSEIELRLQKVEELLKASLGTQKETETPQEPTTVETIVLYDEPGFTTIRTLYFQEQQLEIPYFLRDAFLLPQRFARSENYLIKLGAEQQARIMSELPNNLNGIHNHVKRFSEKNTEMFFYELAQFIEEEKQRKKLIEERKGEIFLFYHADFVVLTEELSKRPLNDAEFQRIPNLLRQLNEDQIQTVGQLPKELVILAKYANVGIGTVEKLFEQLKQKQI